MIAPEADAGAAAPGTRVDGRRGRNRAAAVLARPPVAVVLGVLSAAGAIGLAVSPVTGSQVDFAVYRLGAAHLRQHLYGVQLAPYHLHFTYPPFAALLFWPLAQLPVHASQAAWAAVNLAALVALTAVSIRAARPQWGSRRAWALAVIALFPVLELNPDVLTLDYGQVNILLVLMILADLAGVLTARSRALPRGILTGIAAAVKLTPLIFIPFLLATRQFRAGLTAAGTFAACTLAMFAIAPQSSWLFWSARVFGHAGNLAYISDQNLHSALQRLAGAAPPAALADGLSLAVGVAGVALAAWAWRAGSRLLGTVLCAATGLVISPVSWAHHYVWVVPVLAWLVLGADRPPGGRWWALGAAVLFWAAPIWLVSDVQSGYGGPLTFLAGNAFFLAAAAFLLLSALLLWPRRRRAAGSGTDDITAPALPAG